MTARLGWEAMLVELDNTNSPSLLLKDYNYLINKVINMYINKRYTIYDMTLQTSDDLRVLKATAVLPVTKKIIEQEPFSDTTEEYAELNKLLKSDELLNATYEVNLPSDYLHILNCTCVYSLENDDSACNKKGNVAKFSAKRLTSDAWSTIMEDYYNHPTPKNPYYFINNINTSTSIPTNEYKEETGTLGSGTDANISEVSKDTEGAIKIDDNTYHKTINLARSIKTGSATTSTVEREGGIRYGNASTVRMEIRYGDEDVFKLKGVIIDYLKTPQCIRLTDDLLDTIEDTSQILEFPDYVCQEIINELVNVVMHGNGDPRLQTGMIVNLSIADPTRQLTASTAKD